MHRRWTKQQGRHPQAFEERPSGQGVIFFCVTRHPVQTECYHQLPGGPFCGLFAREFALSKRAVRPVFTLWFLRTTKGSTFWLTSLGRVEYVPLRWHVTGYLARFCLS